MTFDTRLRELIALGTAVGANCHSCLNYHAAKARKIGLGDDEIAEAIEVGKMVRKGAQGSIDKLVNELLRTTPAPAVAPAGDCGCGGNGASAVPG